jgi:hypothetical protein
MIMKTTVMAESFVFVKNKIKKNTAVTHEKIPSLKTLSFIASTKSDISQLSSCSIDASGCPERLSQLLMKES